MYANYFRNFETLCSLKCKFYKEVTDIIKLYLELEVSMKGLKKVIAGTGLLISGSIGSAIGNLEQTTFYANTSGEFTTIPTYYLFMLFMIIGVVLLLLGLFDKEI